MSIKMYSGIDSEFIAACELAEVKPTRRQYKKWQRRIGKAWAAHSGK